MSTLERAIAISAEAHAGQVDKAGQPYILHPLRVMFAMKSTAGRIVGVLHDVPEDCRGWSTERLAAEGFDGDVVTALDFLTRPKGEPYNVYIDRLARYGTALTRAVKVQDLRDNLTPARMWHLPMADINRLIARYHPALHRLAHAHDLEGI